MQRSCPHTFLSPNVTGQYSSYTPTWTIAFSRYKDPVSAYAPSNINPSEPEPLVIVENDAIAVNISNSKGSFGKMANISLKVTNVNYPILINNGDWCFIWINDNQEDAITIARELGVVRNSPGHKSTILNNYKSGFKFIGRVTSTSMSDNMSGGIRSVSCSIQAQAFLEMASSLYYLFPPDLSIKSLEVQKTGSTSLPQVTQQKDFLSLLGSIVDSNIATLASNVYKILLDPDAQKKTPDIVIGLLFLTCLGVSSPAEADKVTGIRGTVSKVIMPTRHVFQILNIDPGKIWDIYQIYLGLQTYNQSNGSKWFESFAPAINDQAVGNLNDAKANSSFFHLTPSRCKGYTPFIAPEWDSKSVWETLSVYLNPVSNEMYTSLKLDHKGQIRPQLIVREVPFSTGNWKKITENNKMDIQVTQNQSETNQKIFSYLPYEQNADGGGLFDNLPGAAGKAVAAAGNTISQIGGVRSLSSQNSPSGATADLRTYYGSLPRWIVDEALITDFTWHTDEADRINFVQITGTTGSLTFVGDNSQNKDTKTASQLRLGNYVVDELDIQRHGTRAFVMSTPFDMSPDNALTFTFAPIWAKMQADWKFNGHLKAKGELTTIGCSLPVAEGDNLEVRGLLFHIEAINHSASLGKNGTKQFRTTYSLSNGVIASSLSNVQGIPHYVSLDAIGIYATNTPGPGLTEVQKRITGEAKSPTDVRSQATAYTQGKF